LFYDEAMSNAATPLDGLVVLDFPRALAGRYCTMATYGANDANVEEPARHHRPCLARVPVR
jgi:crotonobetainyl-CoA:carnitine CoA-transferase CaiB-like acyl-CoA transferase